MTFRMQAASVTKGSGVLSLSAFMVRAINHGRICKGEKGLCNV